MRIVECRIYKLNIPFVESFRHSASKREASDALIVALVDSDGRIGYGEGVARPYVTGETSATAYSYLKERLWPAMSGLTIPEIGDPQNIIATIDSLLPDDRDNGVVAWNASRAAFELALIDLSAQQAQLSIGNLLPPHTDTVTYDGVISSGDPEKASDMAKRLASFGITSVKIKTGDERDEERIAAVRDVLGLEASLRVDYNGACSLDSAADKLARLVPYDIKCAEQPIPRGDVTALAKVRSASAIPIMADESLVTIDDAKELIEADACDFFNIRISKLGGLSRSLEIAKMAQAARIRLQIGCQVGETAILSAAGRALASHLKDIEYLEGSFGRLLLTDDITEADIAFGAGGRAPILTGRGWGIDVDVSKLEFFSKEWITLS